MKIVNTVQNSREWLEWRGKGIGASDAASLMGTSKWASEFELWTYMTGLCIKPTPYSRAVEAMQRGQRLEPVARSMANKELGIEYTPLCMELEAYPFIRASLDGFNGGIDFVRNVALPGGTILEIKCPGKVAQAKAIAGKVPDEYYPQVQQQLLVSGAVKCYYYSWDGESERGVTIEVGRDEEYIGRLFAKLESFWSHVQMNMPPTASKCDLNHLSSRLTKINTEAKMIAEALEIALGVLD